MEEKVCPKFCRRFYNWEAVSETCGHKMLMVDRNNVSYNPMLENCTQDIDASEANFNIYSKQKLLQKYWKTPQQRFLVNLVTAGLPHY